MAELPHDLPGRSRALRPLLVVLALAVVVGSVVVSLVGKMSTETKPPTGKNTAKPAEIVPKGKPAPKPAKRPNVVMMVTDDMRTDDLRWMPNVRSLIEDQGLSFRNSFSPTPLCSPARASLLTGEYSQNTGVYTVLEDNSFKAFDDRLTLGTSLNDAGYNTIFMGKYLNGYGKQRSKVTGKPSFRYVPPGWTDWYGAVGRPRNSGFESGGTYNYFHVLFNKNGTIDDGYKGRYQTRVEGQLASQLVRKYHRSPKPFFMYLAPVAPHFGLPNEDDDPLDLTWPTTGKHEEMKTAARPRSVRGVFDDQIQRASGMPKNGGPSERDVRDKPRPMNALPELSPEERVAVRDVTRQRAEALFVLDQQVKRLVRSLKATGEYKSTVIMFTSDNGYFLGEHRLRQGKIRPHEPSLRVPFVMSGPGIPRGTRYDPITTQGLAATILELAGAKAPHPADGVSVVPSIKADQGWRVPVLTEGTQADKVFRDAARRPAAGFEDPRTTIGIRTPRWKYVKYNDGDGELYDLDRDPNELHSHYDDPRYADVQSELDTLWLAYKDCSGRSCRVPMPADLQRTPVENRAGTDKQSQGVERRYGYVR